MNSGEGERQDELAPTARRLLDAAKTVLLREGPEGFTLRAVHDEAGVRNGAATIYYFGTRNHLLSAVHREMLAEYEKSMLEPFANLSADASLEERVGAFMLSWSVIHEQKTGRRERKLFYAAFSSLLRDEPALLRDVWKSWYEAVEKALFPHRYGDPRYATRLRNISTMLGALWDGFELYSLIFEPASDFGVETSFAVVERWVYTLSAPMWADDSADPGLREAAGQLGRNESAVDARDQSN